MSRFVASASFVDYEQRMSTVDTGTAPFVDNQRSLCEWKKMEKLKNEKRSKKKKKL